MCLCHTLTSYTLPHTLAWACHRRRCLPALQHVTYITPNGEELMAIADEVQRSLGREVLPRPRLEEGGQQGVAADVEGLLRQMARFAAVLLDQGGWVAWSRGHTSQG